MHEKLLLFLSSFSLYFLLLGNFIFSMFGITIHAFRIAGGILIFGIAYNLLHAKTSNAQSPHQTEQREAEAKNDISVTPLALPIMAGPGDNCNCDVTKFTFTQTNSERLY
jgi:MarC family membrane protein